MTEMFCAVPQTATTLAMKPTILTIHDYILKGQPSIVLLWRLDS